MVHPMLPCLLAVHLGQGLSHPSVRANTSLVPICHSNLEVCNPFPCAASGMKLRAIVCESRPLCEGVSLAAQWAEAGVEVTLITDAQVGGLGRRQPLLNWLMWSSAALVNNCYVAFLCANNTV